MGLLLRIIESNKHPILLTFFISMTCEPKIAILFLTETPRFDGYSRPFGKWPN